MNVTKSAIVVATAALAAGSLSALPSAGALPPAPLAPAVCQQWKLEGNTLSMTTSDGSRVTINWDPGSQKPTRGDMTSGGAEWGTNYISGNLAGDTVAFTAGWINVYAQDVHQIYTDDFKAKIKPDGHASGTRLDSANNTTSWTSDQVFTCAKRAEEPKPEPKPQVDSPQPDQPQADPPAPAASSVTVLKESNVFTAPDGGGNRVGGQSYFLRPGRTLTIAEPCRNDWCLLNIPDAEVPNNKGWVYAGEGFLQLP